MNDAYVARKRAARAEVLIMLENMLMFMFVFIFVFEKRVRTREIKYSSESIRFD